MVHQNDKKNRTGVFKMKKRSLSAIMIVSLLLSSSGTQMALAESVTDQQATTEASESVKTQAEFLKMLILSQKVTVNSTDQVQAWYSPYITVAENKGIVKSGENKAEQWTGPITRQEMAKMAVESQGEKLPIDDKESSTAEQVKNAPKDPWGRAIRTTNLPENYKDFPYILADAPNELYDLKHEYKSYNSNLTPVQFLDIDGYKKEDIDKWAEYVEQFVYQIVNVDYTTLDEQWGNKLTSVMNKSAALDKDVANYIKEAKENKAIIVGTVKAEPSIVFLDGPSYMRVHFTFKVTSFDDSNKAIFYEDWKSKVKIEKNVEYEGYSNISLTTAVYGAVGDLSYARVAVLASLFKEASYKPKQ